ncbi:hsp90 co-chaperone Cdc37 [Desmophyllum pertusum]|uniref:Hsp90 chaperone protein kinase-targeting subunit n=1 Tax=Desmophyllum pertusum TaxID=174260 RepID=A0A9W9YF73_9CNID|nr:hsp90 co-chaperone Cdc37 [Desmophyllum pertusum]
MVDYSKWDHIEVSDDEDDTHPNIDTPSLFRWRHQARVDRMDEAKKERQDIDDKIEENKRKLEQAREKLKGEEVTKDKAKEEKSKRELRELEKKLKDLRKEDEELSKKEKKAPKNVDTLSQAGFTRTIINAPEKTDENLTEDEKAERSQAFMDKYKKEIEHYGMLYDYNDSEDYLRKNAHLACDDTANYLALWCINLEVQEKHSLVERVSHQTIIMQYILELAKSLDASPQATVRSFFTKMKKAKTDFKEYMEAFDDELQSFLQRVKERAQARIDKALEEAEKEERQKRLGPGGLDPVEVFESLPAEVQKCFEEKDIPMLQDVLGRMPEEEARDYLKKCIDSGLWIPNAQDAQAQAEGQGETGSQEVPDEERYASVAEEVSK